MHEPREHKQRVIFITIFIIDGSINYGAQEEPRCRSSSVHLEGPAATTADVTGTTGMHGDVDAAGDVVDAGGIVTASPTAGASSGGTGEGQCQQHPTGHAP